MVPEEYKILLQKLDSLTRKNVIPWETTIDNTKFITQINGNSITIHKFISFPEDLECIVLRILDTLGNDIDGFGCCENEDGFQQLNQLYEPARRKALNIDVTINSIIKGLEDLSKE